MKACEQVAIWLTFASDWLSRRGGTIFLEQSQSEVNGIHSNPRLLSTSELTQFSVYRIFQGGTLSSRVPLGVYLATKIFMYTTWFVFFWPYILLTVYVRKCRLVPSFFFFFFFRQSNWVRERWSHFKSSWLIKMVVLPVIHFLWTGCRKVEESFQQNLKSCRRKWYQKNIFSQRFHTPRRRNGYQRTREIT